MSDIKSVQNMGALLAMLEHLVLTNKIYCTDGTGTATVTGVELDPDGDIKLIVEVDA